MSSHRRHLSGSSMTVDSCRTNATVLALNGVGGGCEKSDSKTRIPKTTTLAVTAARELSFLHHIVICDAALGIKAFLDMLYKKGKRLMVFGSACTEVTGPIAQAAQFLHLAQLSYADTHPMYDHIKFPNLYRIVPSENQFNYARLELLRQFNWTHVATLYQNDPRYSLAHNHLMARGADQAASYKLVSQRTFTDVLELRDALNKFVEKGVRIIFGSFTEAWARITFCEAFKLNMFGRKYQWIIWGGYNKDWWMVDDAEVRCSTQELVTALNGYMSTDILPLSLENHQTIAKLTPSEYESMYDERKGSEYSRFHGYTYDGMWAMAKAISIVIEELPPGKTIDMFDYKMEFWSQRFLSALKKTEFVGVTGPVKFYNNERVGRILIKQFQVLDGASSSAHEQIIALFHNDTSFLDFSVGHPVYWHGGKHAPRDRTIEKVQLQHLSVVSFITMVALSIAGIFLAVFFLSVNTKYRNHKYIKMSSPHLNNIIICGCIMTYFSVILLGIDTGMVSEDSIPAICTARLWVLTIGFTSAFGAMFSKTWRVHAIFTNIKLNKKVIKDYQLFLIVALLLFLDFVILLTWQLQDPFTYATKPLQEFEDATNDFLIKPQIGFCVSEHMTIYLGVTYAFKGILMAFGCFLAWETRHVSIPALNDSKYIGMSVYNVVIMCVIGVAISIILTDQQEYAFLIISGFIIFCTTITLCLVFVPKLIELKKNPHPETKRVRATLKPAGKSSKRESFTADLQNKIKTLADQNQKLKESNQARASELDRLIREVGEEAKELLGTRRKDIRPRAKINFKVPGLTSDDDENPSSSRDESSQDQSDQWPLMETSAITKCVYVHYKPRKNSIQDAQTGCTIMSEPSNSSKHFANNSTLPPISDAEEPDSRERTPVTPAKDVADYGGVFVGGPAQPVFSRKPPKKPMATVTENHIARVEMHDHRPTQNGPKNGRISPIAGEPEAGVAMERSKSTPFPAGSENRLRSIMKHNNSVSHRAASLPTPVDEDLIEVSSPPESRSGKASINHNHNATSGFPSRQVTIDSADSPADSKRLRCDVIASL
ncbi:Gamma-aminobutyric acid type B receptor subunit 2 [Hypsibius exemplaris]|uniref:Gamma-aminobutyric acid type B receptor subunit 2 n=1 Tax=Hypsibius exemplaris TaxID=2072580 RepID=A0A1W0WKU1_HYPEX|nr:Gamma-aminobutyric acid type B receptor subunit 2 [Hypsibius exemplaris]